jgi:hypothetical protein
VLHGRPSADFRPAVHTRQPCPLPDAVICPTSGSLLRARVISPPGLRSELPCCPSSLAGHDCSVSAHHCRERRLVQGTKAAASPSGCTAATCRRSVPQPHPESLARRPGSLQAVCSVIRRLLLGLVAPALGRSLCLFQEPCRASRPDQDASRSQ